MIIKNERNVKPGDVCPRCLDEGLIDHRTGQTGVIQKRVAALVCDYCGRISELGGQMFFTLQPGQMFRASLDDLPGKIYVAGRYPAYVTTNEKEIPPNAWLLNQPGGYCRLGPEAAVVPLPKIEVMIRKFVFEGGQACVIVENGDQAGVMFLDDMEFIPFADLGYNQQLGFYQLSAFPDVENEAGE